MGARWQQNSGNGLGMDAHSQTSPWAPIPLGVSAAVVEKPCSQESRLVQSTSGHHAACSVPWLLRPLTQSDSPIVLLRDKHAIRKTLTALGLDHKPETIQLITRDMVRELM
ncbi:CFAP45 [Cervus elaphus hippelaphus]|uniref:CFAP45 n=1 Tax=Cervus elaphus hippelaphus TaxID=46360 RepID=A0A212CG36_CEREH|nr:CFAP45 [Cervus elaphus hippelaphus]